MRWMIFKVIMFSAIFIFMQGAILPWVISNNLLPLWADIGIMAGIIVLWLMVIDRIGNYLYKNLRSINGLRGSN